MMSSPCALRPRARSSANGVSASSNNGCPCSRSRPAAGVRPAVPPSLVVAVKALACELPARHRVPLSINQIVLRIYGKSLVARMYEKFGTFLRIEVCVNRMKDLGLKKGLENLPALREKLLAVTDRLAGVEADLLNVHVDFPLFERLARPVTLKRTRVPGIKLHDTRMLRLMEILLHGGSQFVGWRTAHMHAAVLPAFGLTATSYSLTQLRYDVRKLRAHGLVQREGRTYSYRLTDKGVKVAAMFVLFHKRVCGPLANTLFHHRPTAPRRCQRRSKPRTTRLMPRYRTSSMPSPRPDIL